jgi:hypothetical protein
VLLVGVGAVATADEHARRVIDRLRRKGEEFQASDRNVALRAARRAGEFVGHVGQVVESTVRNTVSVLAHRGGVPNGDEIRSMNDRAQKLNDRIERLRAERGGIHT